MAISPQATQFAQARANLAHSQGLMDSMNQQNMAQPSQPAQPHPVQSTPFSGMGQALDLPNQAMGAVNSAIQKPLGTMPQNAPQGINEEGGQAVQNLTGSHGAGMAATAALSMASPTAEETAAPKIASSFLHVLTPGAGHTFQAIHPDDFGKFKDLIDTGSKNVAQKLQDVTGKSYHLTAKTHDQMLAAGAQHVPGYAKLEDIAHQAGVKISDVISHARQGSAGVKSHTRIR